MIDPEFHALQDEADTLRALASQKPIPRRVEFVANALNSKWEGTRSLAIQCLAGWGKPEFKLLLKPVLLQELGKTKRFSSFLRVVSDSLATLIDANDEDWLAPLLAENEDRFWELRSLWTKSKEFGWKR